MKLDGRVVIRKKIQIDNCVKYDYIVIFYYPYFCRYIYRPSGCHSKNASLQTKLTRSFMCFAFIFIWHGLSWEVFLWTLFNFVGITLETLARVFGKSSYYLRYIKVIINNY